MGIAIKNNLLLKRWAATLDRKANAPAIRNRDGTVERTFADIEREASDWAGRLARWQPGTVVGMQLGNSPAWPGLILAAMRAGVIPLPVGLHLAGEEREMALAACHAGGLVTEVEIEDRDGSIKLDGPPEYDFLKLTSGTTSRPRAIRFTGAQLAADCDNICDTMGIREEDLNFGVVPFSHSYGFSNLITPLLCRGIPLVASGERMPRAILNDLAQTEATVFPAMPLFYEKLAGMENALPLPALRLCISAGAPLPARVAAEFTARFRLRVHTFYGSSECGGIAYDAAQEGEYAEGFVGSAMSGVQIVPIGPRIAVRSAAVGLGYYPDPDEETLGDGAFIPGDLIRMEKRGIYLAGRATDVINIAGRKLNPAEVEARLAQCPGIRQVVVFGIASARRNEEAVACVSGSARAEEVLRYARSVLSGWQVPRHIWRVEEVPFNERGKVSRRDLARLYNETHLQPPAKPQN